MNVTDNREREEAQKEEFENFDSIADEENEIDANESDGELSLKTRQSILRGLGVSDADAGTSYRVDRDKETVRIQRGRWMLRIINNTWTGARIIIEEYAPKKVDKSLVRNQVSHMYSTKFIIESFLDNQSIVLFH